MPCAPEFYAKKQFIKKILFKFSLLIYLFELKIKFYIYL
jgi:hypothetical protein